MRMGCQCARKEVQGKGGGGQRVWEPEAVQVHTVSGLTGMQIVQKPWEKAGSKLSVLLLMGNYVYLNVFNVNEWS